jgi:hypothetical protein
VNFSPRIYVMAFWKSCLLWAPLRPSWASSSSGVTSALPCSSIASQTRGIGNGLFRHRCNLRRVLARVRCHVSGLRPQAVEAIKWAALLCMVVDHIGTVLYNGTIPALNAIGRIAMPSFGIALAYNLARPGALQTGAYRRTLTRLLAVGLIAIPFHVLALHSTLFGLNIMFAFALAVGAIWAHREGFTFHAVVLVLVGGFFVEFGWFGIMVVIGAYQFFSNPSRVRALALFGWVLSLGLVNGNQWGVLALPLVWILSVSGIELPRLRWAFYAFYPAHLAVLVAIERILP